MVNSRYYIDIGVDWEGSSISEKCLIDTGAQYTQLPRTILNAIPNLQPAKEGIKRRGIVPGASRSYSKYIVNLTVGNIKCPNTSVLIPDDSSFLMPLLGIDILSRLTLCQLGGSYQLQISNPTYRKFNTYITMSNISEALTAILSERNRLDLYNEIYKVLPSVIDMEYIDLYKLVIKFIREKSL